MWNRVIAAFSVSLVMLQTVAGVELVLDLDIQLLPGGQATCGVLRCVEHGQEPRLSHITEMTVFKTSQDSGPRRRRTVASLSERTPTVSTLWDGVKAEGTWTRQRAELSLYLTEADDCRRAEFSCRVDFVDGSQQQRVGVARLGNDADERVAPGCDRDEPCRADQADQADQTSLRQLSASLQKLHGATDQLFARLQDNIRDAENRLEDKLSALGVAIARQGPGRADPGVLDKLDERVDALTALSGRLATAVEEARGEVTEPTSGLAGQNSCTRREAVYQVMLPGGGEPPYLCDLHTDGGGWTVIQRRTSGSVDFLKNWAAYKRGFGSLADDFWLGNDRIHALTSLGPHELMVSLRYGNISGVAHYKTFSVGGESSNYTLRLGGYGGSAGDSLAGHNDLPFSTYDRDNDRHTSSNCALVYSGAWWYNKCHASNLNGEWGALNFKGPRWSHLSGSDPVDFSEMKIRRV